MGEGRKPCQRQTRATNPDLALHVLAGYTDPAPLLQPLTSSFGTDYATYVPRKPILYDKSHVRVPQKVPTAFPKYVDDLWEDFSDATISTGGCPEADHVEVSETDRIQ